MLLANELGWSEWVGGTNWRERSETSPACPLSLPWGCGHGCVATGSAGLHLQEPRAPMLGDQLGGIPLLDYKSSVAEPAPERTWGKGVREPQGLAQKNSHSTPGSLHLWDELVNDAVLFFLETTQAKRRGFSRYIKYFLAKWENFSSEQCRGISTVAASKYGHSLDNKNQILHLKQKQIKIN